METDGHTYAGILACRQAYIQADIHTSGIHTYLHTYRQA